MDPEFLAALPEELQREVVESRRREIQARSSAREREEAQRVRQRAAVPKAASCCPGQLHPAADLQCHVISDGTRPPKDCKISLKRLQSLGVTA